MGWKKTVKKTSAWLAVAALVLLVAGAGLFGLAQTEIGKREIGKRVARALSREGKIQVEWGRMTGLVPFRFSVERISVSDPRGRWLLVKEMTVHLSPLSLLKGQLRLKRLAASVTSLDRLPETEGRAEWSSSALLTGIAGLRHIRVEHLLLEEAVLGERLLGEKALFQVQARILGHTPEGEGIASLRIERKDGPGGLVRFEGVLGRDSVLAVDAAVEEPEGGIAGALFGLGGPLSVSLHGEGPLEGWKGRLLARSGRVGELRADLFVSSHRDERLVAKGTFTPADHPLASRSRALLGSETRFSLEAHLAKKSRLVLDLFSLKGGAVGATLRGTLDLDRVTSEGGFTVHVEDLAPLKAITALDCRGRLTLDGRFAGPLLQPRTSLDVKLESLEWGRLEVGLLEGRLALDPLRDITSSPPGIRLSGEGRLHRIGMRHAMPFPEQELHWKIAAEGPCQGTYDVEVLRLAGERHALELSGNVNEDGSKISLRAEADISDLMRFSSLLGYGLPGTARIVARVEGNGKARSLDALLEGKVHLREGDLPPVVSALGREFDWSGEVSLKEGNVIDVSGLRLDSLAGTLTGTGSLHLDSGNLRASWQASMPDLPAFSAGLGLEMKGSARAEGTLDGVLARPGLEARIWGRDVVIGGLLFEEGLVHIRADGLVPESRGRLSVEARHGNHTLQGMTDYAMTGERLSVTSFTLRGPGTGVTGALSLDFSTSMVQGEMKGKSGDLSLFSPVLGGRMGGSAEWVTQLKAGEAGQGAVVMLKARDLISSIGEAEYLELRASLGRAFTHPNGSIALDIKGYRHQALSVTSFRLGADGDMERLPFSVRARGRIGEAFDARGTGLFSVDPDGLSLVVHQFTSRHGTLPFALSTPVRFRRTEAGLSFDSLSCKLGQGRLEGAGKWGKNDMGLRMRFESLPLEALESYGGPPMVGAASGEITLLGPPDRPEGSAEIRLSDLALPGPRYRDLPYAGVVIKAACKGGRLSSHMSLRGLTDRPFTARWDIPFSLSFSPLRAGLSPGAGLEGSLDGEMDLAQVSALLGCDDQTLIRGKTRVGLVLGGTTEEPRVSGGIVLEKGAYEELRTGTVLKDVEIELEAVAEGLLIRKARATDGEGGAIQAQGWLHLLPAEAFPFLVKADFTNTKILRRDDAHATAGGHLQLSGSFRGADLSGEVQVTHGEFHVPEHLAPDLTPLEVEDSDPKERRVEEKPKKTEDSFLTVDVAVMSPGKVFLEGRGLESEWAGAMRFTGKGRAPALLGSLSVVRGGFNFLGKKFNIQKGVIDFNGMSPPSPTLDVLATATAKDVTARVELLGPVQSPETRLSSEPLLPPDEILSRLLFGRNAARITPLQAVQLASALNTLRGGTSADLMGHTRRALGVDQLEVRQSTEKNSGTSISAGKYLSETVYIEVEKGLGEETGKASVKWEITPNVSLETEVGAHAEKGAGILWKWDY